MMTLTPRRRFGRAAVVSLLAAALFSCLPVSATAATFDGGVTSVAAASSVENRWDEVQFTCTWQVPDNSRPGDSFTLQLPPELRWFGSPDFSLKAPEGEIVATGKASTAGLVVFTLSDYVTAHPRDVSGTCSFSAQFVDDPGQPGTRDVIFTSGSSAVKATVPVVPCSTNCGPAAPGSPGKSMWWTDGMQTRLESVFYLPAVQEASNNVTITDTPSPGMTIDCKGITPRTGRTLDQDGNIAQPFDDGLFPAAIDCAPERLTVSWTGLPAGQHVELFVVTAVSDPSLNAYTNTGVVTVNGTSTPVGDKESRSFATGTGAGKAGTEPLPSPTPAPSTPSDPTPTPTASPTATDPSAVQSPAPGAAAGSGPSNPAPGTSLPVKNNDSAGTSSDELAVTGSNTAAFLWVAVSLMVVGAAALAAKRRIRPTSHRG